MDTVAGPSADLHLAQRNADRFMRLQMRAEGHAELCRSVLRASKVLFELLAVDHKERRRKARIIERTILETGECRSGKTGINRHCGFLWGLRRKGHIKNSIPLARQTV